MSIAVKDLHKTFGAFTAVDRLTLEVPPGELVALLGPSGSGKTTLLRLIAGLDFPDSGTILFDERDATRRSAKDRRVGFVFQHYALFRHMTVAENVAFGLKVMPRRNRPSKAEIAGRVTRLLKLVQLDWLADRFPSQLSGGQRQRVALARALAIEPSVLLLDEPFGALDAQVRKELRRWLRGLHDEIHLTSVFVTHDQEEAMEVADRVVVMNQGRIEQIGTPVEIHDAPATPFVYEFLGHANKLACRVEGEVVYSGHWSAPLAMVGAAVAPDGGVPSGGAVAYVRAHELDVLPETTTEAVAHHATIRHMTARGGLVRLEMTGDDGKLLEADVARPQLEALDLAPGRRVAVRPRVLRLFAA